MNQTKIEAEESMQRLKNEHDRLKAETEK